MADISIKCSNCGAQFDVSEFASEETLICPSCTRHVRKPETERGVRLKVKKHRHGERATLTGEQPLSEVVRNAAADQPVSTIYDAHKVRSQVKKSGGIWGVLVFLVLGGLLVGAQYYLKTFPQYMTYYEWTRTVVLVLVWVLVLVVAFEDSYLQGILCLLLPFYILYYAFARLDLHVLRGAFAAVVVMLGTELHFVNKQSVLVNAQQRVDKFILDVGNLIQRAGDSPDIPASRARRRH